MKTEYTKDHPLYVEFKEALNIQHDMRPGANPYIIKCIEIAEEYASQFKPTPSSTVDLYREAMTDKQPQTCYVFDNNGKSMIEGEKSPDGFGREFYAMASKVENVYLFTPEELEALKAKWMREAAENVWDAAILSSLPIGELLDADDDYRNCVRKQQYLDKHYPLPKPINTNQ